MARGGRGSRSAAARRRRLQIRLCQSIETLLRLGFGLPLPADQGDHLPLRPALTREVVRLLSVGALDLDCDADLSIIEEPPYTQPDHDDIDRLSAVSSCEE